MTKVKHLHYTQEAVDKADARLIFAMDIARSTCGHFYGGRESTTNGMARYAADLSEAIFDAAEAKGWIKGE